MTNRAIRLHGQHDLRLETAPDAEPGEGEALVRVVAGGICGSDLHYLEDGGIGAIRVREPIILGHEAAGIVERLGPGAEGLVPGDRVALNPSQPCGQCRYCLANLPNQCLHMRFRGSAMRLPHEQGLFRDRVVLPVAQCVRVSPGTPLSAAACAEPLAVCLHAMGRAGALEGARVLITGAGPIGALCTAAARHLGAAEIVVTDLQDMPLAVARRMGADRTVNVAVEPTGLAPDEAEKGRFDVAFECSAAAPALDAAIRAVRPQGRIVQVGVAGSLPVAIGALVAKELALIGSHRFHAEFAEAARLIDEGAIDVAPIVTHSFPLGALDEAFRTAADRTRAVKAQLSFEEA